MSVEAAILVRLRALLKAENSRDAAACAALFAPEATVAAGGQRHTGRAAIEQAYRALFTAFPDAAFRLVSIHLHEGATAIVETAFTGTHLGHWAPDGASVYPPTGRPFQLERVQVLRLDQAGQISHCRQDADIQSMLEQLHLLPGTTLTRERLLGVLERITAAWNQHDLPAIAACYTPEGTAQFSGGPPAVGRAAIEAGINFWFTAFPDLQLITEEALTEGNRLIQIWTVKGHHTGPLGPIPPTNQPIKLQGIAFMDCDESGLITSSRDIFDRTQLFRCLGIVPQ